MSDNANRIPHHRALRVAEAALDLLGGAFERAAIAGSLRRGRPTVGDIELVLRPTYIDGVNLLEERIADRLRRGVFSLRRKTNGHLLANGPRYKALWLDKLPLDLFIVLPDRHWGPTMLIRTGPGDANQVLVTEVGLRNENGDRGVLPVGLRFEGGAVWNGGQQLTTPEEIDVLHAVGLPWIPPDERSVTRYQELASGESCKFVVALAKWPLLVDAVYGPDGKVVAARMPDGVPSGGRAEQMGLF